MLEYSKQQLGGAVQESHIKVIPSNTEQDGVDWQALQLDSIANVLRIAYDLGYLYLVSKRYEKYYAEELRQCNKTLISVLDMAKSASKEDSEKVFFAQDDDKDLMVVDGLEIDESQDLAVVSGGDFTKALQSYIKAMKYFLPWFKVGFPSREFGDKLRPCYEEFLQEIKNIKLVEKEDANVEIDYDISEQINGTLIGVFSELCYVISEFYYLEYCALQGQFLKQKGIESQDNYNPYWLLELYAIINAISGNGYNYDELRGNKYDLDTGKEENLGLKPITEILLANGKRLSFMPVIDELQKLLQLVFTDLQEAIDVNMDYSLTNPLQVEYVKSVKDMIKVICEI